MKYKNLLEVFCVCFCCLFGKLQSHIPEEGNNDSLFDFFKKYMHESGIYSSETNLKEAIDKFNEELRSWNSLTEHAYWNYLTNISGKTSSVVEEINIKMNDWESEALIEINNYYAYKDLFKNKNYLRMLELIHSSTAPPMPNNRTKMERFIHLSSEMQSNFASAKVLEPISKKYFRLEPELEAIMANVTYENWEMLKWAWTAWRDATGPVLKPLYEEWVELANEAARNQGFEDIGQYWRISCYEMDNLHADALYKQVEDFYALLHGYVRRELRKLFPDKNIAKQGPIPAHILGNMWAQDWSSLINIMTPYKDIEMYDVTEEMVKKGYNQQDMFKIAEDFFTSIGLDPMTDTFWEKTMMVRPEGRDVECHASAEDFYDKDCEDFRIKMCAEVNMNDLKTVHHEMGHIQYFMNYCQQPTIYRQGANAAFHEAIGDTIALSSMSQEHLATIGLIDRNEENQEMRRKSADKEDYKRDINFLMKVALEKLPLLPFALVVDKWRWAVFSGQIQPSDYNKAWWSMVYQYQGVVPPVARNNKVDFDPSSKYHIAAGVPYIRYFFSYIVQFQFHKALCDVSGHSGVMHHCDIYKSIDAGKKLKDFLSKGRSQPWQKTLQDLTGMNYMDGSAILYYFRDLKQWLKLELAEDEIGW